MTAVYGVLHDGNADLVRSMGETVVNRGDIEQIVVQENCAIGVRSRNLAQPTTHLIKRSEDRFIFFDGDLINIRELHALTHRVGAVKKNISKEEIIVSLFDQYGINFVELIEGPFILVVKDRNALYLVRDRMGVKPLYYFWDGDRFLFASQMKSLAQVLDLRISRSSLEERYVFGDHLLSSTTYFDNVSQVGVGQIVEANIHNHPRTIDKKSYKSFSKEVPPPRSDEYADELRRLLERNVKHYVDSRSSVGIFLSGGFDSSVLAALAVKFAPYKVQSYTISDSEDFPDVLAAREVADHLGLNHSEIIVDTSVEAENLVEGIYAYEDLIYRDTIFMLAKSVAGQVEAVISGGGADIFGVPVLFRNRLKATRRRWQRLIQNEGPQIRDTEFGEFMGGFLSGLEVSLEETVFDHFINDYLPNQLFPSSERAAEYYGLEVVFPFADPALRVMSQKLRFPHRISAGIEKPILREAFKDIDLPESIMSRPTLCSKHNLQEAKKNLRSKVRNVSEYEIPDRDKFLFPTEYLSFSYGIFSQLFTFGQDPAEVTRAINMSKN